MMQKGSVGLSPFASFFYLCDYVENPDTAFDLGERYPLDGDRHQNSSDRSELLWAG